jgi:hypothetical protein
MQYMYTLNKNTVIMPIFLKSALSKILETSYIQRFGKIEWKSKIFCNILTYRGEQKSVQRI